GRRDRPAGGQERPAGAREGDLGAAARSSPPRADGRGGEAESRPVLRRGSTGRGPTRCLPGGGRGVKSGLAYYLGVSYRRKRGDADLAAAAAHFTGRVLDVGGARHRGAFRQPPGAG